MLKCHDKIWNKKEFLEKVFFLFVTGVIGYIKYGGLGGNTLNWANNLIPNKWIVFENLWFDAFL